MGLSPASSSARTQELPASFPLSGCKPTTRSNGAPSTTLPRGLPNDNADAFQAMEDRATPRMVLQILTSAFL